MKARGNEKERVWMKERKNDNKKKERWNKGRKIKWNKRERLNESKGKGKRTRMNERTER